MRTSRIGGASLLVLGSVLQLVAPGIAQGTATEKKGASGPLQLAHELGKGRFKDTAYGDADRDKAKINCVQWVLVVIEELAKRSEVANRVTEEVRKGIAISNIKKGEDLDKLVEAEDPRIKGVASALVAAGLGEIVALADAKPGDFVQYWYKHDGHWSGHAAMIESIEKGTAVLLGSHQSSLASEAEKKREERKGGVGPSVKIQLGAKEKKVYCVRWKV